MKVDTRAARATRGGSTAAARGHAGKVAGAAAQRARRSTSASTRAKSLAATGRYLKLARERFGREDLAFVSYHMGIGNLESVLRAFGGGRRRRRAPRALLRLDAARATPRPTRSCSRFGDDSSNYFWKLLAAREIMRLYRDDRAELARLIALHAARPRPRRCCTRPGRCRASPTPSSCAPRWDRRQIVAFPDAPRHRPHRDPRMGELAPAGPAAGLYRGLRPEALGDGALHRRRRCAR